MSAAKWRKAMGPGGAIALGTAGARLAALRQVEGRVFALLPAEVQAQCLEASLRNNLRSVGQACLTGLHET